MVPLEDFSLMARQLHGKVNLVGFWHTEATKIKAAVIKKNEPLNLYWVEYLIEKMIYPGLIKYNSFDGL